MSRAAIAARSGPVRLALEAVGKRFGAVTALAPLTLELPAGTIHGVLGENGAGKSTLVRIVAGALAPDGGRVLADGRALPPGDPRAARAAGIGAVHQHFALIGALTVAENLLLGRPEAALRVLTPRRLAAEAEALARAHGLDVGDPGRPCRELPVGTQARLEILRALSGAPRVLLLDEPTAVLTPGEIADLFETLRRLRAGGMLIVLVTHKLEEALALCDRVTILRGGRLVATVPADETSARELAGLMVGAGEAPATGRDPGTGAYPGVAAAAPALAVRDLSTGRDGGRVALDRVTLDVAPGEICGVAGVDGNGQEELAAAVCGLLERDGTVAVAGVPLPSGSVRAAQRAGLALIPADRRREGLALGLSVWENALLAAPLLARFTRRGFLDRERARAFAAALAREYRVALASVEQPAGSLSGGNQQRIVVGRALALRPRLLVAVNPTRGLDIAATAQVHATLTRAAAAGTAVLLVSSDLDELLALAGRLFALYRGRLAGPVAPAERERLGALMAGVVA